MRQPIIIGTELLFLRRAQKPSPGTCSHACWLSLYFDKVDRCYLTGGPDPFQCIFHFLHHEKHQVDDCWKLCATIFMEAQLHGFL